MENEQPQFSSQERHDVEDLLAKYESLRQVVVSVLLLLVVITGTFWIFMMRQVRTSGADLAIYRAQTTNLLVQLRGGEPMMDDLFRKFQAFGRTNPDFLPILAKYGIGPETPIGTASTNRPPVPLPTKKK